jgi:hypothetical protein
MTETPTASILDDADLRTIRDALKEGKQVKLLPDGSLEVSSDVVDAPMGAQAEAYIESQLGDVKVLLEKGFEMNVHPAGQVFGSSADGLTRVQGDLDPGLGRDDLLTIKVVLGMGANVAVLPDGTVQTRHHLDQTPRTTQQVDDLLAQLDARVQDGSLVREARAGRGLTIADAGDGQGTQLRFAQSAPDEPGIALPDDPVAPVSSSSTSGEPGGDNIPEDPTGVDLADLADRIDARADALRTDALEDQVAEATRVGLQRDESAREAWMAQQGHEAAFQQARRELKVVQEAKKQVEALEAKAVAAEKTHTPQHVEDLRQSAAAHQARLDVARQRMESAEAEANRLGQEAAAHRDAVTTAETRLAEIATQSAERVKFADMLEIQAGQVRAASQAMDAGKEGQARAWLTDARVVGAGESEPADLVPDEPVPSPGPITSPSQVDDGPITSPSQVDDVTGAGSATTVPDPAPADEQPPLEPRSEAPAEQPAPEQPADDRPANDQPVVAPAADLDLSLQAADSIESDLTAFAAPDPEPEPEPEIEIEPPAPADALLDG